MAEARRIWDVPWAVRPREESSNLNPAFCGELIFRTAWEYQRIRHLPLAFALSFVVLPIALHKRTREELPGNSSAAFVAWVAEHTSSMATFPDRVIQLMPVTREALLFLIQHQVLKIDNGGLVPGPKPIRLRIRPSRTTDDAEEARSAASLLGRWFANQGLASSIMQGLGVAP
jgi:Family of unknown function (DUF6521)